MQRSEYFENAEKERPAVTEDTPLLSKPDTAINIGADVEASPRQHDLECESSEGAYFPYKSARTMVPTLLFAIVFAISVFLTMLPFWIFTGFVAFLLQYVETWHHLSDKNFLIQPQIGLRPRVYVLLHRPGQPVALQPYQHSGDSSSLSERKRQCIHKLAFSRLNHNRRCGHECFIYDNCYEAF